MVKWAFAFVVLLAALGFVIVQLGKTNKTKVAAVPASKTIEQPTPSKTSNVGVRRTEKQSEKVVEKQVDPATDKLDPTSDTFSDRIDVGIPDGFRAKLADCERGNMDPDAKISLSYTLHIEKGIVSASNVEIEKSDLNNQDLEQCMVDSIQNARWEADDMPDFSEEQDLFIRMRSLDKYLSEKDQLNAKARNKESDVAEDIAEE